MTRDGIKRGDRVHVLGYGPGHCGVVIETGTDLVRVQLDDYYPSGAFGSGEVMRGYVQDYWSHEVRVLDAIESLARLA